jgi:hypothetical protein
MAGKAGSMLVPIFSRTYLNIRFLTCFFLSFKYIVMSETNELTPEQREAQDKLEREREAKEQSELPYT